MRHNFHLLPPLPTGLLFYQICTAGGVTLADRYRPSPGHRTPTWWRSARQPFRNRQVHSGQQHNQLLCMRARIERFFSPSANRLRRSQSHFLAAAPLTYSLSSPALPAITHLPKSVPPSPRPLLPPHLVSVTRFLPGKSTVKPSTLQTSSGPSSARLSTCPILRIRMSPCRKRRSLPLTTISTRSALDRAAVVRSLSQAGVLEAIMRWKSTSTPMNGRTRRGRLSGNGPDDSYADHYLWRYLRGRPGALPTRLRQDLRRKVARGPAQSATGVHSSRTAARPTRSPAYWKLWITSARDRRHGPRDRVQNCSVCRNAFRCPGARVSEKPTWRQKKSRKE